MKDVDVASSTSTSFSRSIRSLRSDCQPIDDSIHAFRALRDIPRLRATGPTRDSARQGHDMLTGIDADVAIFQQVLAHEACMDVGRDPCVCYHFTGFGEAILGRFA